MLHKSSPIEQGKLEVAVSMITDRQYDSHRRCRRINVYFLLLLFYFVLLFLFFLIRENKIPRKHTHRKLTNQV